MLLAAEYPTGQGCNPLGKPWIGVQETLEFQPHLLFASGLALVALVELAEGLVIVFGPQQFAALDSESLGDLQRLLGHSLIEAQEFVEFIGRQEVPVDDLATKGRWSGWSANIRSSTCGFRRRSTRPMRCMSRTGFQCRS